MVQLQYVARSETKSATCQRIQVSTSFLSTNVIQALSNAYPQDCATTFSMATSRTRLERCSKIAHGIRLSKWANRPSHMGSYFFELFVEWCRDGAFRLNARRANGLAFAEGGTLRTGSALTVVSTIPAFTVMVLACSTRISHQDCWNKGIRRTYLRNCSSRIQGLRKKVAHLRLTRVCGP